MFLSRLFVCDEKVDLKVEDGVEDFKMLCTCCSASIQQNRKKRRKTNVVLESTSKVQSERRKRKEMIYYSSTGIVPFLTGRGKVQYIFIYLHSH